MATRPIGVLIEGATGRLGTTQHLRSLMAIRSEGGLLLANGDRLVPEPMLLGRDPARLAALAAANGGLKWSTDPAVCLADRETAIYFDASATGGRPRRAGAASSSCVSSTRPASSAAFCRSGSILAGGSSTGFLTRRSGRAGITAKRR